MDIKLIALDLDGTLLLPDKSLSPRNRAALTAAADRGIHIVPTTGRLFAGLPEVVITRARALLRQLEQQQPAPQQPAQGAPDDGQLGLQDLAANAICQRLEAAAPETMTPIEALNFIFELKQLL